MKKLILSLLLTGWVFSVSAQELKEGIVFMENESWELALKKAKEQHKLIFIDCYTVWCGPCKSLSDKVFPQKKSGGFF